MKNTINKSSRWTIKDAALVCHEMSKTNTPSKTSRRLGKVLGRSPASIIHMVRRVKYNQTPLLGTRYGKKTLFPYINPQTPQTQEVQATENTTTKSEAPSTPPPTAAPPTLKMHKVSILWGLIKISYE